MWLVIKQIVVKSDNPNNELKPMDIQQTFLDFQDPKGSNNYNIKCKIGIYDPYGVEPFLIIMNVIKI